MRKLIFGLIIMVVIAGAYFATHKTAEAPVSRVDYRCGDGSEFTLDYSIDKEAIHIIPASNIERVPDVIVTSLPKGSRERYEGGGVSLFLNGKSSRVTVGENPEVIECSEISSK